MLRLQQILFFRELDFSLGAIKTLLDDPAFDVLAALHELALDGDLDMKVARQAIKDLDIDPGKLNPHVD